MELKQIQQDHIQSRQALMKANQELLEQLHIMKTQLTTVKDDIRNECDMKIGAIFDKFRDQSHTQQPMLPPQREDCGPGPNESPARKKRDNKGCPFFDRLLAMGEERRWMEQLQACNWLLTRFIGAAGYTSPVGPPMMGSPGCPFPMQHDLMNLPQAQADHKEHVG